MVCVPRNEYLNNVSSTPMLFQLHFDWETENYRILRFIDLTAFDPIWNPIDAKPWSLFSWKSSNSPSRCLFVIVVWMDWRHSTVNERKRIDENSLEEVIGVDAEYQPDRISCHSLTHQGTQPDSLGEKNAIRYVFMYSGLWKDKTIVRERETFVDENESDRWNNLIIYRAWRTSSDMLLLWRGH